MAYPNAGAGHGFYRPYSGELSSTDDRTLGGGAAVCAAPVFRGECSLSAGARVSRKLGSNDAILGDIPWSRHTLSLLGDSVCGRAGLVFSASRDRLPPFSPAPGSLGYGTGRRPWTNRVSVRFSHFKVEGRLRSRNHQWMAGQFVLSSRA